MQKTNIMDITWRGDKNFLSFYYLWHFNSHDYEIMSCHVGYWEKIIYLLEISVLFLDLTKFIVYLVREGYKKWGIC